MMSSQWTQIRSSVAAVLLTVALAACDVGSVHRPGYRTELYRISVAEYKGATVVRSETNKNSGDRVWNYRLPPDSPVKAIINGTSNRDITVTFPDEPKPRIVHSPEDYTTNLEVRIKGSTLYVYRMVSLLRTEYRLAVYDLVDRKLVVDVLVAPEDMPAKAENR